MDETLGTVSQQLQLVSSEQVAQELIKGRTLLSCGRQHSTVIKQQFNYVIRGVFFKKTNGSKTENRQRSLTECSCRSLCSELHPFKLFFMLKGENNFPKLSFSSFFSPFLCLFSRQLSETRCCFHWRPHSFRSHTLAGSQLPWKSTEMGQITVQ